MIVTSISQRDLQKWLPTAIDPTAEIYEQLRGYLESADIWLAGYMLGSEKSKQLAALFADGGEGTALADSPYRHGATLTELREEWVAAVVYTAFVDAIPMLDLVLTPNGFGVVSTNQVAPASRERVTALRQQCRVARAKHIDKLLLSLPGCKETELLALDSADWLNRTGGFIRTTEECRAIVTNATEPTAEWTMEDLWSWQQSIHVATTSLYRHFSLEQMEALINAMRKSATDEAQQYAIERIRGLIGAMLSSEPDRHLTILRTIAEIIAFMEEHEDSFQPYVQSKIYAARHASRYESAKDDPCYFF